MGAPASIFFGSACCSRHEPCSIGSTRAPLCCTEKAEGPLFLAQVSIVGQLLFCPLGHFPTNHKSFCCELSSPAVMPLLCSRLAPGGVCWHRRWRRSSASRALAHRVAAGLMAGP